MSNLSLEYIEMCNNSEKYIVNLQICDKITVKRIDICPSDQLIIRDDPLWGYYNVTAFKINGLSFSSQKFFPGYRVLCGDCYMDECYLLKQYSKQT
jgi:hypothetical protein